ncbi:MAG TPA: DUF4974 domain-containing protein [Sphingobacterium sp.]|nr:DUF4974 domain-containing protein [Sphingobacterium sp.]
MKGKQRQAKEILQRYVKGQCSEEERTWVEEWYKLNYDSEFETDSALAEEHFAEVWQALDAEIKREKVWSIPRIAAIAATIAVVLGISIIFVRELNSPVLEQAEIQQPQNQILAGRNQALLILADGRTIHLDSVAVGDYVIENGIVITKMDDGTLAYHAGTDLTQAAGEVLNTVSTPRGGQYKVILPDNSIVWLNAASTLRFPVAFAGTDRTVELEGEGYFEVAHDAQKPFIVTSQNQQILVKGTKFNITAYSDDSQLTTTLLEGAVLVRNMHHAYTDEVLLRPNEQAVLKDHVISTSNVEAMEVIAWKNGKFIFNHTPLQTIMQQLSRWYDVDVVYLAPIDDIAFTGSVSRFDDIQDVLRKISLTESIRFETKERRVMVKR